MKLKDMLSSDDKKLFKNAVTKVKPIVNDTIHPVKRSIKPKSTIANKKHLQQGASFFFSDQFEPNLPQQGPVSYVREGSDSYTAKSLRRGQYTPDLILDLHGLDQHQAKLEIAALLHACQKEHVHCVCIVHGLGARILKNKVPHWLVQHPDVIAFHQAPLEWGGKGAVLVLIEIHDKQHDQGE